MKTALTGWSRIHQKKGLGPLSLFLAFISIFYGLGVRFRLWAYLNRVFKRRSLPGFVVSIGNLTAGGTGKTPAVVMLARWALDEGYRVAVLSRGYRGQYRQKVLEVSDGKRVKADSEEAGDEPYLLAGKLPGVSVVVSRKRYLAGLFAHEKFGADFFILDDGFQHLELNRDLDLVLIDAANPLGNGHLLPWGPLREPVGRLARADALILARFRGNDSGQETLAFLKRGFPSTPFFCADHMPEKVVFPHSNDIRGPGFLRDRSVVAFAGIARPQVFKETLIGLGANVVCFRGFADHYRFKREDIEALIQMKEKCGADYLLTTEKDWVRIAPFARMYPEMGYLCIIFQLLSGEDDLLKMIKDGIRRKQIPYGNDI